MTNSWTNADGEPIMDGAAWRFEQVLDEESARERWDEDFYAGAEDEGGEECEQCDDGIIGRDGVCDDCGFDYADTAEPMEDQWLDGSYEE
jgi:hypothetical protein